MVLKKKEIMKIFSKIARNCDNINFYTFYTEVY